MQSATLYRLMTKEVHDARIDGLIRYYDFINDYLPIYERKHLKISSINALVRTYQTGLGIKELIATHHKFRNHRVKLLDKRFLNPISVLRLIRKRISANKKRSRVLSRLINLYRHISDN